MTASIGFRAPSDDELAQALLARLADTPEDGSVRARRYRDAAQRATGEPGDVPAPLQRFARDVVARALARPWAVERALGEWLTEPKAQVWFDAGEATWTDGAALQADRRTRMAYDARHVYVNGESFRAAGRDARLMRRLADCRRLGADDVARLSDGARAVVADWLGAGWLRLMPAPDGGEHDD